MFFIILTGYYSENQELKKILDETKLYDSIKFKLYILSHKAMKKYPMIFTIILSKNWEIIYQPNIGWDWLSCSVYAMA